MSVPKLYKRLVLGFFGASATLLIDGFSLLRFICHTGQWWRNVSIVCDTVCPVIYGMTMMYMKQCSVLNPYTIIQTEVV